MTSKERCLAVLHREKLTGSPISLTMFCGGPRLNLEYATCPAALADGAAAAV